MKTIMSPAEVIGKKANALKRCEKLLSQIEINGHTDIVLNCGLRFPTDKGDEIHIKLKNDKQSYH